MSVQCSRYSNHIQGVMVNRIDSMGYQNDGFGKRKYLYKVRPSNNPRLLEIQI